MRFVLKPCFRFVAAVAFTVSPAFVVQSHAQLQPVSVVPEVVVTATRFAEPAQDSPVGVTVIGAQEIRNSTALTVPELLMRVPGVHVRDSSGSPNRQVDMRGFGITGDQNTLVLLDGHRISENELASVNWMGIPLSSVERIEVMRGSGAVLYGGGATGGTINIITKSAQTGIRSANIATTVGSYGTYDYRLGANLAGENVAAFVNAEHLETNNYRYGNRFRDQNGQADIRYTGPGGMLYAKLGSDDQKLLLPGALTQAQIALNPRLNATPGDFSNMSSNYANLGGSLNVGDAELALNAGYRTKNAPAGFNVATPFGNNTHTAVDVWSLTPRAKIPFAIGGVSNTLVTGVDWDQWKYNSTIAASANPAAGPYANPASVQRNTAWYFQNTSAFGAKTLLSVGARVQSSNYGVSDQIGGAAAHRNENLRAFEIALRHRIGGSWNVYGKFGNSFRVPNVNEIYDLFSATVTMLEPQTSHDREVGTNVDLGRAGYRLALYEMDTTNEIHFNPVTFSNVNLAPTRRYGAELSGKWTLTQSVGAYANYTYAVSRFVSGTFSGNEVPLVPRNTANLGATWEFMPRTRLIGAASHVGTQVFDGDEANALGQKMPRYTLVDLKVVNEMRGWLLSGGVRNLFNQHYFSYAYGFPAASGVSTYVAYPAAERAIFVSAQYTFR
jgi:iron complex outermembrane recepter protein